MERQVYINGKLSLDHYGFHILEAPTIGYPKVQTYKISVPFRNGEIDLTNHLGEPTFSNGEISIRFFFEDRERLRRFAAEIHGRPCTVSIFPPYYHKGTAMLKDYTPHESDRYTQGTLVIDCEPFSYNGRTRGFSFDRVEATKELILVNEGFATVASFTGSSIFELNGEVYDIDDGEDGVLKVKIPHGKSTVKLRQTSHPISCTYKERFPW